MTVSPMELGLRQRIMAALAERMARDSSGVRRDELSAFVVDGQPIRLIDTSKGIWNPSSMGVTLSIISSPDGPYADEYVDGGFLRYRYRAGSIAGDNTKLRAAVGSEVPLILLRKIAAGLYLPVFPVYAVGDDPGSRSILVALDESLRFLDRTSGTSDAQRRYAESVVRVRLHQPEFRARVIVAYRRTCSVCSLRHPELLDAAHIIPDGHVHGLPIVPNGLALCKIHHAAYDHQLIGIDPDYVVHVDSDLLTEVDGPMLKHGLQEMDGRRLIVPRRPEDRPDRERLATRFDDFRRAS